MYKQLLYLLFVLILFNCITLHSQDTTEIPQNDTVDPFYQDSVNLNLLLAAEQGDKEGVLEALRSGADINTKTYFGVTPLMYATQENHLNILKILLHNGADPKIKPSDGTTPLIMATIYNHLDAADILIQYGADINTSDDLSANPLLYASFYGYYYMTDMLLYYGANINYEDDENTNAIILASFNGKPEIVDMLAGHGADINSRDVNGFTPLIVAAQNGHFEVAEQLIEKKADVNARTIYNTTAFFYAVNNGYTEIVKLLMKNGANTEEEILKGKKLNSLPSIYNYPLIRKVLRENGLKLNYWPGFNSISIGPVFNFNIKDILSGLIVGINDYKYNLGIYMGYEMRYRAKRTLVEKNPVYLYQFWERRSAIHLSVEKRFNFFSYPISKTGWLLGAKTLYTFGSYRGASSAPESKFKFTPQAGLYYANDWFKAKLIYEYIDYGNYEVPPHRLNIQLLFDFKFIKYKKYEKKVTWLVY